MGDFIVSGGADQEANPKDRKLKILSNLIPFRFHCTTSPGTQSPKLMVIVNSEQIGHFRVPLSLSFKASLSAKFCYVSI